MKSITVKDIRIREIVIQPYGENPMAITYELLDSSDQIISVKNTAIKRDDFTTKGKKAIEDFATDLLTKVKQAEAFD